MKLYSYYKDGFYSGIYYSDKEDDWLHLTALDIKQRAMEIPTITFTCYDKDQNFEVVGGEFFYKGERVDGVTEFEISVSGREDCQMVTATLEFPVDVPFDFDEGFIGSGCRYYD